MCVCFVRHLHITCNTVRHYWAENISLHLATGNPLYHYVHTSHLISFLSLSLSLFPLSLTPVSDATHSVTQLHLLLENKPPSPAEDLHRMCSSCTADPLPDIEKRVAHFGEAFLRFSPQVYSAVYTHAIHGVHI